MFRTKAFQPAAPPQQGGYSFFNVFFLGISCVIGTGIYFAPVASVTESGPASMMALVIAGLLCISVALPFAELSSRISGFSYEYIYCTCGEFPALFYTLGVVFVNIFVSAITAQLWSSFALQLLGLSIPDKYVAVIPLALVTALVLSGMKSSAIVSNVATIINLLNGVMAGILLWMQPGFRFPGGKLLSGCWDIELAKRAFPTWFFTLLGFENVGAIARNAKNASKVIPASMIGPLFIAIALNLVLFLGVLGQSGPVRAESVLGAIKGSGLGGIMTLGALLGVTSSLLWITLLQGEMMQTLSTDGLIHPFISKRSASGTPYVAAIMHMAAALVCCYLGSITSLISTLGWTIIGMPMGCLGLLFLRYDDKSNPTQLAGLKRAGLVFAVTFVLLGVLDAFPWLPVINSWTFRGLVAAVGMGMLVQKCKRAKMVSAAAAVPCVGFPYVPIFGAMSFFFVVGYTMNIASFLVVLGIALAIYVAYSSGNSTLNERPMTIEMRAVKYPHSE